MKTEYLSVASITVLDFVERPESRVDDDLLRKSIETGGIQQPLIVVEDGPRKLLVDGFRRLTIARSIKLPKVPAVIDSAPPGIEPAVFARRLRFIIDQHRQDLLPSQRAELIDQLKKSFGMTHAQIAAFLGIVADSVTNWLAVRNYIAPVVKAMDGGSLTMQAARVFDGMSEQGQRHVWRVHGREIMESAGGRAHKSLRERYSPENHPTFYRDPELVKSRLARTSGKRKTKNRVRIGSDEKKRLLGSFEMKDMELKASTEDLSRMKAEITAAVSLVAAIMRSPKLLALVPPETREELERFAEIYV